MSKNRKRRKPQSKSPNRKGRQSQKKQSKAATLHKIKTFFIGQKEQFDLKKTLTQLVRHAKTNRNSYLFFTAMALVVTLGYFTFVYESADDKAERISQNTVSVDLNEEALFTDAEAQLADVQENNEELVVTLPDVEETTDTTGAGGNLSEASDELPVADPVERISSSSLTEIDQPAAATEKFRSVSDSVMLGIDTYALIVDGKEVAYFKTEGEAYVVINDLKREYMVEGAVEERIIFQEDIKVEPVKKDILTFEGYKTKEEVLEYIKKGTNEQKIHVVESGENPWTIAHAYGLGVQQLLDANPDVDPDRLQIGHHLSLIVPEPVINVVTITTLERTDPIAYGNDPSIETDKYYKNVTRVKREGVFGEAENTIEQYMVNGKVIGEKVIESKVIKEPINQILYVGTKPLPPLVGTGTWKNPTSRGYITSGFGSRSLGWHNGIDIGVPMHTEVRAADGGIVIFAGYKGTFGKLVMIDHGRNTISYYAHNDVLKVQKGDRVAQGQLISLSGNTGRSTGPHLHFEVRINGTPVNPRKFVNY